MCNYWEFPSELNYFSNLLTHSMYYCKVVHVSHHVIVNTVKSYKVEFEKGVSSKNIRFKHALKYIFLHTDIST